MTRLLTPTEAGEILRLNAQDVKRLVRAGKLGGVLRPAVRPKGKRRVPRMLIPMTAVEKYVAELESAHEPKRRRERVATAGLVRYV